MEARAATNGEVWDRLPNTQRNVRVRDVKRRKGTYYGMWRLVKVDVPEGAAYVEAL